MTETTRRRVLGAVAGVTTLAGCTSSEEQEPDQSAISVRTVELSTESATMQIETRLHDPNPVYELYFGWERQTLARIEEASSSVSSVLLTHYAIYERESEASRYVWSVPDDVPGETKLSIEEHDLLEMRVVDVDGSVQITSARVPEMQAPTEAQQ